MASEEAIDQNLHCLSFSLWIWTKTLYDVIWLADSQKWVWLIQLFSRIRVKFDQVYFSFTTSRYVKTAGYFFRQCRYWSVTSAISYEGLHWLLSPLWFCFLWFSLHILIFFLLVLRIFKCDSLDTKCSGKLHNLLETISLSSNSLNFNFQPFSSLGLIKTNRPVKYHMHSVPKLWLNMLTSSTLSFLNGYFVSTFGCIPCC